MQAHNHHRCGHAQGRCELFKREAPDGEEETFEWTEEEKEVGAWVVQDLDTDKG